MFEKTARYGTRHVHAHTHQSIIGHAINYEQQLQIILHLFVHGNRNEKRNDRENH